MKNRFDHKRPFWGHACEQGVGTWSRRAKQAVTVAAFGAALLGATLAGPSLAQAQSTSDESTSADTYFDPLEPFNRTMYGVNYVADHVFLRPIAYAYRDGVPDVIRSKVTNTLRNLKSPIVLANDLLQGEWDRAGDTSMRFLINSTVGVLGIFDVATEWGYPYHQEDFGQTLAVAGIGDGPYLVLPLLGPSNSRDAVGTAVDWFFDPLRLYGAAQNPNWEPETSWTRTGVSAVNTSANYLESLEELERSSIDTYATMRSAYGQIRRRQIANTTDTEPAPSVSGASFDFNDSAMAN
jgi:phospholipid-binding lipoprotein MlaA